MEVHGKRLENTAHSTTEEIGTLCELCEADNVSNTANGKCRECKEYMCLTCFRHHLKAKSCRNHVLIGTIQSTSPVKTGAVNVEICTVHANEAIKFYCHKHETVGCGECMIPVHVACQPENIKDLSKGFHQTKYFKGLMRKLETIMSANKENGKHLKECMKENDTMLVKALKEIRTFREEINFYLDSAEANIIKEARNIERENDTLLTKLSQDCEQLSSRITEVSQKLDPKVYKESALFIQTVDCKPRITDIEREVVRLQNETDIGKFEFMPDKQLHDIITSIAKLGRFDANERLSPSQCKASIPIKVFADHNSQKQNKEKGQGPAKQIAIGARVRPIGRYLTDLPLHKGKPGTVTDVNPLSTVCVKWDATGETVYGHIIGTSVQLM